MKLSKMKIPKMLKSKKRSKTMPPNNRMMASTIAELRLLKKRESRI